MQFFIFGETSSFWRAKMAEEKPHRRHSPPSLSSYSSASRHTSTIPYLDRDLSILANSAGHICWLPPVSRSPSSLCRCSLRLILSPSLSSSPSSSPHQSSSSHSSCSTSIGLPPSSPTTHPGTRCLAQPLASGLSSAFSSRPTRATSLPDSLLSCRPSSVSPSPLPCLASQFRRATTSRRSCFSYRSHSASSSCASPEKEAPREPVCYLPLSFPRSFPVSAVSSVFLFFPLRSSVVSRRSRGRSFASCSSASYYHPPRAGCSTRRTSASSCNPLSFHPSSSPSSARPMPCSWPRSGDLSSLGPGVSPRCLLHGRRSFGFSRGAAVRAVIYRRDIVRSSHTRATATNLQRRSSRALSRKHSDCFKVDLSSSRSFFREVPSFSLYPFSDAAFFGVKAWSSPSSSRRFSFTRSHASPLSIYSWSPSSARERPTVKFTHSSGLRSLPPHSIVRPRGSLSPEVHGRHPFQVPSIRQLSACDISCFPHAFVLKCYKPPMYLDRGFFSRQGYCSPSVSLSRSPPFLLARCMYTSAAGKPRRLTIIPIEEEESDNGAPSLGEQQENVGSMHKVHLSAFLPSS